MSAERDDHHNDGGTDINKLNDPGATHYYGDGCDDDHGRADHPLAIPNVHVIVINDVGEFYDERTDDSLAAYVERAEHDRVADHDARLHWLDIARH